MLGKASAARHTVRREFNPRISSEVCAASMRSVAASLPFASRSLFLYARRMAAESAFFGKLSTCCQGG